MPKSQERLHRKSDPKGAHRSKYKFTPGGTVSGGGGGGSVVGYRVLPGGKSKAACFPAEKWKEGGGGREQRVQRYT